MTLSPKTDATGAGGRPLSLRGKKRKAEILDAVLTIVGRDGMAGLSMRTLAAEAGIPLGATTYYFTTKSELVAEAFRLHAARETERVLAVALNLPPEPTALQLADQLTGFLIQGLSDRRLPLIAEYELLVEATRDDELATLSRSWLNIMQDELKNVMTRLGSRSPEVDVDVLLGLLAGLEVDHLSDEPTAAERTRIRMVVRRAVMALFPAVDVPHPDE
jgi:TetR/AcrR family transcriptional regulator, regulator of biofilm formation and stress response